MMRLAGVNVAGQFPFGEHRRVVLERVAHDRPQVAQGLARRRVRAGQTHGGADLAAFAAGLVVGGIVKIRDGLGERVEKIRGQIHGQELRFHRRGVLKELPGGGEQRAVAGAAGHAELGLQSRRAEVGQGVRAFADGLQLVVQIGMNLRLGERGLFPVALGGFLVNRLSLRLRHGGSHLRKQRRADAADREFGGVFEAEVFGALEGVRLVSLNVGHKCFFSQGWLMADSFSNLPENVNRVFARG